jgi:hypothetical protein
MPPKLAVTSGNVVKGYVPASASYPVSASFVSNVILPSCLSKI